ncbi:probable blue pigment (indigoidine) exporter [Actinomadura madurae]|uniref:Probable blue pigment (Indigoidine) exporter n=1 Tax=Actinomadura madurae TaxID=1993 RepID=A0A1I5U5H8_9ACTN|nr:EamA family transporter [Actinomadura madurae]SFP90498.1 probable blue pigment (indigoidine) exporter [Actinomadura madurae]
MTTITAPNTPSLSRPPFKLLALVAATALAPMAWGTTYAVTTELLPPDRPLFAALMRSLPLGLLAVALSRTLPRGDWWWKAPVLGIFNIGAFFPLLFLAAERLPGGVAATLGSVQPLIVAGLAVAVLRESPSSWRLSWGTAGVVGVGLVVIGPGAGLDPVGIVAGLGGAVSMATGVTLTKRWGRPAGVSPLTLTGWLLSSGGLFLLPLTLVFEGVPARVDAPAVAGYLWLATVGGVIAYMLWFRGIGRLPVTAAALLGLLSPLVAALLGVLLVGEACTVVQVAGFALALAALVAGQFNPARARAAAE